MNGAPSHVRSINLGSVVITSNALLRLSHEDVFSALSRHGRGDWGDLGDDDRETNERGLIAGERLLSAYRSTGGITFWVITEWDRSLTTILLPEDY